MISTQDPDGRDPLLQRDARLAEPPLHVTNALLQVAVVGGRRWALTCKFLEEALRLLARFLQLGALIAAKDAKPASTPAVTAAPMKTPTLTAVP